MIEFKAECGHTVRAKDEDAGGVVRCSYCGRNAAVPDNTGANLDFLFSEVEQQAEPEARGRRRKRGRTGPFFGRRKRTPGGFNPFAVVLRLCYAAALIIIVVVVAKKVVVPMFDPQKREQMLAGVNPNAPPLKRDEATDKSVARPRELGLVHPRVTGLWVASTPSGAEVYCVADSKAPPGVRIQQVPGCVPLRTNDEFKNLPDGSYTVEVVFPWNDAGLKSYPNYLEFRKQLKGAAPEKRKQLANQYFIPDEAASVFVDKTEDQYYLVRQYRGVTVRKGQPNSVRALFLPWIPGGDPNTFVVEKLVSLGYIPDAKTYEFDKSNVRDELAISGVVEADQPFVLEALSRIGLISYMSPERSVLVFKIGIQDGGFASREMFETSE